MPLYEYECKSCDQVVEVLVRTSTFQAECPRCGRADLQRVLSVPASPAIKSGSSRLPMASEGCGAPSCCGGGCQL